MYHFRFVCIKFDVSGSQADSNAGAVDPLEGVCKSDLGSMATGDLRKMLWQIVNPGTYW